MLQISKCNHVYIQKNMQKSIQWRVFYRAYELLIIGLRPCRERSWCCVGKFMLVAKTQGSPSNSQLEKAVGNEQWSWTWRQYKHTGTIMYFLHEHHLKIKQLQSTRVTKELGQCCYFETFVALVGLQTWRAKSHRVTNTCRTVNLNAKLLSDSSWSWQSGVRGWYWPAEGNTNEQTTHLWWHCILTLYLAFKSECKRVLVLL